MALGKWVFEVTVNPNEVLLQDCKLEKQGLKSYVFTKQFVKGPFCFERR